MRFGTLEHDQSGWPVRKYLAAQFAADASAGPGHDYCSTLDHGTHRFMTNLHRRPAEKVVNVQWPQISNSDASGRQLIKRGNCAAG